MKTVVRVMCALITQRGVRRGFIQTHTRNELGGRHIDLKIEANENLQKDMGILDSDGKVVTVHGIPQQDVLERYRCYYHAEVEGDGTLRLLRKATMEEYLHALPPGARQAKTFVM